MNKLFKNMKIRKKLILSYILACVVPLTITCVIIYQVSTKALEETSLEFANIFSSQIVMNMDAFIEEYDKVTKSVLVDNDIIYQTETGDTKSVIERVNNQLYLRKIMLRLVTLKPEIKSICFLTGEKQFYQFTTDGSYLNRQTIEEQSWLESINNSKDNLIVTAVHSREYSDRDSDGIVITVGRKIFNNRGAFKGVLLIDLEPTSLIELSDGFLLARNQYNIKISITNMKDEILYDSDVASGLQTWGDATINSSPLAGKTEPNNFIVLSNVADHGNLKVNVVIPKSDLLFKINKVGYVTLIAILSCTVLIIIISTFFSKMITKPIGRLQKRMRQVEDGEYKELIQKESDDEIGSLVSSYNQMVLKIKTLIEKVYLSEIKQKNARYLALKTQINPHMLYNTLESIRMKAIMSGSDEVAEMIKVLAKMFRMTLTEKNEEHRISDEVSYVEMYLFLQNIRFPNSFELSNRIPESILQTPIISMILQPIIENSIEHGFRGRGSVLKIDLLGTLNQDKDIVIQIRDNGKGMAEDKLTEMNALISNAETDKLKIGPMADDMKTGIGLKSIAERIKLYYGSAYYLMIREASADGTVIELCVPSLEG